MSEPVTLPTGHSNMFDPSEQLRKLRTERPIAPLLFADEHVGWVVTEYAPARAILADSRFSSRQELRHMTLKSDLDAALAGKPARPGMFIHTDAPQHTRYRKPLTGQFTVRRMNLLTERIEQIVAERLAEMEKAGPPADLVQSFALPVPSMVICELLGVPYEERERFQRDVKVMQKRDLPKQERMAANQDLIAFLRETVLQKRAQPTDDILSGLTQTSDLSDDELTGMMRVLLVGGHETTANMFALGAFALFQHPKQLAAFKAADEAGVAKAVEELLRYLTILQFGLIRTALADVEVDGVQIKSGQSVCISLPEANRDPKQFPDPNELDITREAAGHLAFGHGAHRCLGEQLARIEMRIGFTELFRRFPDLRPTVPPEQVALREDMVIYGVHELPVTW